MHGEPTRRSSVLGGFEDLKVNIVDTHAEIGSAIMLHYYENQPSKDGVVYTCPMHPEVRQPQPGKCPECGMTLKPVEHQMHDMDGIKGGWK